MYNVYLLQYNNYFNRIVKGFQTLAEYAPYVLEHAPEVNPVPNVNFNPNDGVNTEQIVNWNGNMPDYVIADSGAGFSRWFVIGHERTRGAQYRLFLRRDLVMDYYSAVVTAPCFIQKATLLAQNNLIFNSENMTFNQIKTSERLLKDAIGCPWVVIYAARYTHDDQTGEQTPTTFSCDINTIYPYRDITQAEYTELANNANKDIYGYIDDCTVVTIEGANATTTARPSFEITLDGVSSPGFPMGPTNNVRYVSNARSIHENFIPTIYNIIDLGKDYVTGYNEALYDKIINSANEFLRVPVTGGGYKFYKINYSGVQVNSSIVVTTPYTGTLEQALEPLKLAFNNPNLVVIGGTTTATNIWVTYKGRYVSYTLTEVEAPTAKSESLEIQADRYHLIDAPYDMFVLPFSSTLQIKNSKISGWKSVRSDLYRNLQAAGELLSKYGGTHQVFDAQILPYCPIPNARLTTDGEFDLNDANTTSYSVITKLNGSTKVTVGYIFHCSNATFQKEIPLSPAITISDWKIESECDMYRLCSPNYSGVFEFNAAKNGGISTINVACTYKPYMPYIKVYPTFGRLYGSDYNDARGLICGGDFSIAAMTDAWETYQLQNRNYQASFDRQIENLEIHNKYGLISDVAGAISGTASGTASGAALGGGPVGAVVGGLASAVGGAADVYINQKLRSEDLQYTKDRFGYELGNIRALPQSLSKTSAYSVDNKYFPFLEYYTCTAEEKAALKNKIKYNGMTVMAIGTISQYINANERTYIKGQLIRIEDIDADYNVCRAIYDEINKGVYV